jgi:twitching motility protein PilJ
MALGVKKLKMFSHDPSPTQGGGEAEAPKARAGRAAIPQYDPLGPVTMAERMRAAATEGRLPRRLPLIGRLTIVRQFQVLGLLLVAFLALALLIVFLDGRSSTQSAVSSATATEMQMLSQRLARSTALAAQGQAGAFAAVKDSRERFKADLVALQTGGVVRGVRLDVAQDPAVVALLQRINTRWNRADANAERVMENQQSLTALAQGLAGINAGSNGILELAQRAAQQIAQGGGTAREVEYAGQLAALSQRIAKNANALASGAEIDTEAASLLGKDAATFRDVVIGLARGSEPLRLAPVRGEEARATLTELQKRFTGYDGGVGAILQNMDRLVAAKQAARGVNAESEGLLAETTELAAEYEGTGRLRAFTLGAAIVFALLALACLIGIGKVFLDDARVRAFASERENRRNQEAILRLLNEMGNLADGDLTTQASVTEDVTGAIADSINFTIEELRTLVRGINSATDQVTAATQDAQAVSHRLYEASQRQSEQIQQASASVLQMAHSIEDVSQAAGRSAKVAQQSLATAEKGGVAVQNQIAGMNEIRTQIQDTSKRIKRLGESSLEIGEIVELIADITEQTNVLALNAAIQAASAGEAGRGFSVVAEEVQRLAERSGEATRQIEAIVKTIQSDTQDAVAAMEKSTVGVVEGTKLSDAAGQALEEIRKVSRDLAALIGGISSQTQKQLASVSAVTEAMQGILRITEETTEGTKQTNVSISQLTGLAAELRSSVAGFKV